MGSFLSKSNVDKVCKRLDRALSKLASGNVLVCRAHQDKLNAETYLVIGYNWKSVVRLKSSTVFRNSVKDRTEVSLARSIRLISDMDSGVCVPIGSPNNHLPVYWLVTFTLRPYTKTVVNGWYTVDGFDIPQKVDNDFQLEDVSAKFGDDLLAFTAKQLLARYNLNLAGDFAECKALESSNVHSLFVMLMNPANNFSRIAELLKTYANLDIDKMPKYLTQESTEDDKEEE